MKPFTKNILIAGIAVMISLVVTAQTQYTSSDLSITALTLTPAGPAKKVPAISSSTNTRNHAVTIAVSDSILKCTITVHNGSGRTRQTTMIVQLPENVTITSELFNVVVNKTGDQNRWGMPGSLVYDLFNLSPNSDITIEFTFTKSATGNKIGAYVYSGCPDPDPANNYKSIVY